MATPDELAARAVATAMNAVMKPGKREPALTVETVGDAGIFTQRLEDFDWKLVGSFTTDWDDDSALVTITECTLVSGKHQRDNFLPMLPGRWLEYLETDIADVVEREDYLARHPNERPMR